jgi:hypothetical protein
MRWREFGRECPELAEVAREWLAERHILLLGTLRPDGSPRISAVECDVVDGADLCCGMIWQSTKALDLLRDPRMTAHSLPPGMSNPAGDLKLYGRAVEVTEPAQRRAYEETLYARIEWKPDEPYHLFALDIESAGFVKFVGDAREVVHWRVGTGLRTRRISG